MFASSFFRTLSFALVGLFHVGAAAQSGLDNAEPVGAYLNGVFPTETPGSSGDWELVNAFPNLTFIDPVQMLPVPGTNQLMMAEKNGRLAVFDNDETTTSKTVLIDFSAQVQSTHDSGFLGFAFHPEFGQAGSPNEDYLYIYYRYTPNPAETNQAYCRLSRLTWELGSNSIDPLSEFVLINQYDRHNWHNGGGMFFGDDGFLYLSIGDEGGANDQYNSGQKIDASLLAGVFRIDVDQQGGSVSHPIRRQPQDPATPPAGWPNSYSQGYFIPSDNPWLDVGGGNLEEFWAVGTRSPHRMTIDRDTGDIYLGDVGQGTREEISLVEKEANLQWPYFEGTVTGPKAKPSPLIGFDRPPLFDYGRSDGGCICGGYVYRGATHANSLAGKYIFGDHNTGEIWALTRNPDETVTRESLLTLQRHGPGPKNGLAGFGVDADNEIYVLSLAGTDQDGGIVYRLARNGSSIPDPPALLSQTGAFSNLSTLTPSPGLMPFGVNAPLWTDGAAKQRWIAIPNDGTPDTIDEQVVFSEEGNWSFPVGSVTVKQFTLNGRHMETRFMVHGSDGVWYGVTYRWREDQTDADLIFAREEDTFDIGGQSYDWTFPSRSDCMQCHTGSAGRVLGPRTRQLNGDLTYPVTGRTANQLVTWNQLGFFATPIDELQIPGFLTSIAIDDTGATDEDRARSYLDSNCAHCHNPVEGIRDFDFRLPTPLALSGVMHGSVRNDFGIAGAKEILPGDPSKSMAHVRQNTSDEAMSMPPLGRHLIDATAVAVIADWIAGLDPAQYPDTGLFYEYYEGTWSVLPDFTTLTPVTTGEVNTFDLSPRLNDDLFAFRFNGYLNVTTPGSYTFYTSSDDGSRLWINGVLVVDNDGLHGEQEASGSITLTAGYQEIVVGMFEQSGAEALSVSWEGPGIAKEAIPTGVLSRNIPNAPPVLTPIGDQLTETGTSVNLTVSATDPDDVTLTYGATGLPPGLSIDSGTGQITGTASTAGIYPVTITVDDGRGGTDDEAITWTVEDPPGGGPALGNLVVHLPFDEGAGTLAADASGNGHDGQLLDGAGWAAGYHGQAAQTDGVLARVRVDHTPALHLGENDGDFTVAFRVNLQEDATGSWRGIAGKGESWDQRGFALFLRPDDNRINFSISTTASYKESGESTQPLVTGQWTHIALVKQASELLLYLDGTLESQVTLSAPTVGTLEDLFLGDGPGSSIPAAALYDSLQVYNRALDLGEVQQSSDWDDSAGGGVNVPPVVEDQTFTVTEGSANGTVVGVIAATDPNTGPEGTLAYAVTGGSGQSVFQVDPGTGEITVVDSAAVSLANSPFQLDVTVSDGGSPSLQDTALITIDVTAGWPALPSGLQALLPLEEGTGFTATDATGNGHTGMLEGGVSWTAGQSGWGIETTGVESVDEPITFSAFGDVPYSPGEIVALQDHIDNHNLYSPAELIVHLGDINAGTEPCEEARYDAVAQILLGSQVPAFIVPGDNEWTQCDDPVQGRAWWDAYLMGLHQAFCGTGHVDTQAVRPENFAFLQKGVLFIGLSYPDDVPVDAEQDDVDWIVEQFAARGGQARAAVIFAQKEAGGILFDAVKSEGAAFGKPVIYIHGDGHSWIHDAFFGEPNMERVQVERGTDSEPPVQFTVTLDPVQFLVERDPWPAGTPVISRPECSDDPQLRVAHAPSLHLGENDGDFTVAFWVNLQEDATGAWRGLAGKGEASDQRAFSLKLQPDDNRVSFSIATTASTEESALSAQALPVGQWTHVAFVKEAAEVRLYLDGGQDNSLTLGGMSVGTLEDLFLGRAPGIAAPALARFDSLQIYDRALSATEVQASRDLDDTNGSGLNVPPTVEDQTFTVTEGSVNGTVVGTIAAIDPNTGPEGALAYTVTGGSGQSVFQVDAVTGEITVADSAAVIVANSPFQLDVSVSDGGSPSLRDTALITIGVTPSSGPGSLPSGLLAWLPFEDGAGSWAGDASGNGHDGELIPDAVWAAGQSGGGIQSPGSSTSALRIAHAPALHLGESDADFTVAFWVNLEAGPTGGWRGLAGKGDNGSERGFGLYLAPDDNKVLYSISTSANAKESERSNGELVQGQWNHLAFVKEGATVSLYLDGQLDGTLALGGPTLGNLADILLGQAPGNSNPAPALFDSLQIYDRALNAAEVVQARDVSDTGVNLPPQIEDQLLGAEEGVSNGTVIGTVLATDPDTGPEGTLTYTLTGGSGSTAFSLDSLNGQVTVIDSAQVTVANSPMTLDVTVADGGTPSLQDNAVITVSVTDPGGNGLPPGLAAWLPFEDGTGLVAADASGNAHDGQLTGSVTWGAGQSGGGVESAGGSGNYVEVAHDAALHLGENDGDFSVAFWVNLLEDATGGWRGLAGKGVGGSERGFAIFLRPNNNKVHFSISTTANAKESATTTEALVVGQWTHIAYVKEASEIRLYLDGALVKTKALNGASTGNLAAIYLGDAPGSAVPAYAGYDSFQVYNRALTDLELQQAINVDDLGGGGSEAGNTVLTYDLDPESDAAMGVSGTAASASGSGPVVAETEPQLGSYTFLIAPDPVDPAQGDGYGTLEINPDATASIEMVLGDGTSVQWSGDLESGILGESEGGPDAPGGVDWDVAWRSLPGVSDFDGRVTWEGATGESSGIVIGSRLDLADGPVLQEVFQSETAELALLGEGVDQVVPVSLTTTNEITGAGLAAALDVVTGKVTGTLLHEGRTLALEGVLHQEQGIVGGLFRDGELFGQIQVRVPE